MPRILQLNSFSMDCLEINTAAEEFSGAFGASSD